MASIPPDGPGSTLPLAPGDALSEPPASPEIDPAEQMVGRLLAGRYLLERVIGRGGMGIVYAARHVRVGRQVAVKVLRSDLTRVPEATARFHREAQAAAAVGSQHIVDVIDHGYSDDGEAFIVMELLVGEDLRAIVKREGALPPGRAVGIARQTAEALQCAHDKGIIHRDLKSENVFVTSRDGRDFVKVVDFGISKVLEIDGNVPITQSGSLLGTPHYMAPEQGSGDVEPDHRIDLYALGCILFEMLTGELPFNGRTAMEVMYKHAHETPRAPSSVRPLGGITPALDAVVLRCLSKDRDKRFPSATALADALPDPLTLPGGQLAWTSAFPVTPPKRWRKRAVVTAIAVAFGLGVFVAARGGPVDTEQRRIAARLARLADAGHVAVALHDAGAVAVRVPVPIVVRDAGSPDAAPTPRPRAVLTLLVRPDTSVLRVDGQIVGTGDFTERFAVGSTHRVSASATGYAPHDESVTLDSDMALRWTLVRQGIVHPTVPTQHTDAAVASPTDVQHLHDASSGHPIYTHWGDDDAG